MEMLEVGLELDRKLDDCPEIAELLQNSEFGTKWMRQYWNENQNEISAILRKHNDE